MKRKNYLIALGLFILIIIFDQLTKLLVVHNMELGESIPVIRDVFEIHYIQNTGMAWGLFSGKTWLLALFSVVMLAALLYVYHNIAEGRYYRMIRILLICIVGGAYGNLLDRIRLGYVIDFLYFKLINFPVFNVADIFVTISVILLILLMIFKYKGNDLDVMLGEKIRLEDGTYIEKKRRRSDKKEDSVSDGDADKADDDTEKDTGKSAETAEKSTEE